MRNCQICNRNGKRVILNKYHDFEGMCLFECTKCGHRYIDGLHLSQAWFDDYYLTKYQTDDKPYSDARLNSLAECVKSYNPINILDIGGMDGELQKRFSHYDNCDIQGVGDKNKARYEAVILSHTLEHIYDIGAMFERIDAALNDTGYLFIEVPVHLGYNDPKLYDLHFQHVNKFRPIDLERLCTQKGYEIVESKQIADYREYQVWRLVGRRALS
jgi:hypothetical protein